MIALLVVGGAAAGGVVGAITGLWRYDNEAGAFVTSMKGALAASVAGGIAAQVIS